MACIYKRKGSPFWWLKWKSGGKWRRDSTGLRFASEAETRAAVVLKREKDLEEAKEERKKALEYDWSWVEGWLEGHCKSVRTLQAYQLHWRHIRHWMTVTGICHPSDITFRSGHEYVAFRTDARAGHKVCGRNTALLEVKLLGQVLRVCALRGEIAMNPIRNLGIARERAEKKRELTDEEIGRCLAALPGEEEWIRLSFLIGLHTGCRLRETRLRMDLVDLQRRTMTFVAPKGGEVRSFTRPLPEALVSVLELIADREWSHEFPFQPSRCFQNFFQRVGVQGVSFHCLRVSYITRLHRAGVPLSAAMRLVNHSSEAVHAVYRRLEVEDVRKYSDIPLFEPTMPRSPSGG